MLIFMKILNFLDILRNNASTIQKYEKYKITKYEKYENAGVIFQLTPAGTLTPFYNLCVQPCADGEFPFGGLILAADGNFYGTADIGGANHDGAAFRVTPGGTEATIYSFCSLTNCPDGAAPQAELVQGTDGNFYGTTSSGGDSQGHGTIFRLAPDGTLTTIYTFCSQTNCTDGFAPSGGLLQGRDGNFYGMTTNGGQSTNSDGTVFKITPGGVLTTIHSFSGADGRLPYGTLVRAYNGNFYATSSFGGANNRGTVFQITPAGVLTTVYSFCSLANCADGASPFTGVIQGTDGNFYGVTRADSNVKTQGTIFKVTPGGVLTTLHKFGGKNGSDPRGTLVQATNGSFYGATQAGGTNKDGTAFRISTGLRPFVKTVQAAGKAGDSIIILGNNLTGTTSVAFNGTASAFTVVSDTEITATVPTGATTGRIQVVTPGGTLTSNVAFRVF